jgi:hypothetical protein
MATQVIKFSSLIDLIYNMSLEDRVELKSLLEHNIADSRRDELLFNFKKAQQQEKLKKLKFSSNIQELKKNL